MLWRVGMHCGFLAARCEWPDLCQALQGHCGTLREDGAVPAGGWFSTPGGQDILHVTSGGGCCYVLDPQMVLSANSDLIVALSREASCMVAGAGAETVSGTFWFTAAETGGLRRLHFDVKTALTAPFDLGQPLDGESSVAWDDVDGKGITAGLAALGFDPQVFSHGGPGGRRVLWLGEKFPGPGELGQQVNDHARRHQRPDADQWMSTINVVSRSNGGFDIRAEPPEPPRRSRFRRLFRQR